MANNDFNINLSAFFDEDKLHKQLTSFFKSHEYTVRLNIDLSDLQTQLNKLNVNIGTGQGGTSSSKSTSLISTSSTTSGVSRKTKSGSASVGMDLSTLEQLGEVKLLLDAQGKTIGAITTQYQDLNNVLKTTWTAAEDGTFKANNAIASHNTELKKNIKLSQQNENIVYKLKNSISSYANQAKLSSSETKNFNQQLENIIKDGSLSELEKNEAFKKLNSDIRTTAESTGLLGQSLAKAAVKFATWYLIAGTVTSMVNAIKSIVYITVDLNKAFTSIQMVTGQTTEEIKELRSEYIALAKEMGVTVDTVVSGADEWLRAGLSVQETTDALRASLVLSSVASMDSADATKYLVAAMNGFGLQASELIGLVDKLSAIDVVAATSSEELGLALSYSANSAQLAGISLDKYLGMIATVSETTRQSASTIGNSFRSIFTRLQKVNIGTSESSSSISDVDSVLKQYGIDLMEASDNLNDMGALLDTLGEKWDKFTTAEKSAIATTIAGNYQRERFLVLMSNYDRALELEQVALNSSGSATDKYTLYQESLEAAVNRVKDAWIELVNNMNSSGLIDLFLRLTEGVLGLVGGFNSFIANMPSWVKWIIGGATAIMALAGAILIAKSSLMGPAGLIAGIAELALVTISFISFASATTDSMTQLETSINGTSSSIQSSTKATTDYETSLSNLNETLQDVSDTMAKELSTLRDKQDELKKEQSLQDKLLKVEQARADLAEAKRKRTRIFRAGVGFTYTEDTEAVQTAQTNLQEAMEDLSEYKYEVALERAEDFVSQLNELLTSGDIVTGWAQLFDDFGDLLDSEFAQYLLDAEQFIKDFNQEISGTSGAQIATRVDTNAQGTRNYNGGVTWVGEQGPELVKLPKGTEILDNGNSMKLHDMVNNPSFVTAETGKSSIYNFNISKVEYDGNDYKGFIDSLIQIGNNQITRLG